MSKYILFVLHILEKVIDLSQRRRPRTRAQRDMHAYVLDFCEHSNFQVLVPGDVDVENVAVVVLTDSREVVVRRSNAGETAFDRRQPLPSDADRFYEMRMIGIKTAVGDMLHTAIVDGRLKVVA